MGTHIHQIFYDAASQQQLDRGFIPLENRGNPRPDWREYWAIRQYFHNNTLNENDLYGFFSPNFKNKTLLDAGKVFQFINANPGADVYHFSPFFQDSACYLNMFEQGNRYHPGMVSLVNTFLGSIDLNVDLRKLAMDFRSTIYCNFMVAKPVFWEKWFAINERLFEEVEQGTGAFAQQMNALTTYHKMPLNMKVFIMERIASLILALDHSLSVAHYDIAQMPWSDILYYPCRDDMFTLNALKLAYLNSSEERYLQLFYGLRNQVLKRCDRLYGDEKRLTFFD
ncbi:hypothetical protein J2S30_003273 [Herbaspirillum rubrisubalbicans]|jgi:hypothetical protein|uniref:hypothetical protein n=1 Tax=Herbaspirillum rubrisubalbicans TaxID=80842 RepID=UPI00209D7381|nr:hypothetical protein [Herbaspirillum rubrisubalbicans]MCP1574894.1 hypothetical protein [Herbaspirillum rubrisubalbicans]